MKTKGIPIYLAGLVALTTLCVFLPALGNGFVIWDDELLVVANPHIRSLNAAFFAWAVTNLSHSLWQPGAWLSHAIDYALWGLNPLGHHLSSIVLHAVNTFLVTLLTIRLLEASRRPPRGTAPFVVPGEKGIALAGAVTGALFGVHPLHVEPAVWITGRTDLISAFFSLLSLMAYIHYAGLPDRGAPERGSQAFLRDKDYLLSFVWFLLALTGKPAAVTLPGVFLLLDWFPLGRIRGGRDLAGVLFEKLPFVAGSVILTIVTLSAQSGLTVPRALDWSFLAAQTLASAQALVLHLWRLAVPLHLLPVYPLPENLSSLTVKTGLMLSFGAGTTVLCILLARKRPALAAVWFYFLITLLPTLGVVGVRNSFIADRYSYLPSLGPFLLAGLAAARVWAGSGSEERTRTTTRRALVAAGIILFLSLTVLTERQIAVWKNSVVLWSHVIEREPTRVPIAYNNRGLAWKDMGRPDLAIEDYSRAIELAPNAKSFTNRAIVYAEAGNRERALDDLNAALELDPEYADAYTSRGLVCVQAGKQEQALRDLDRAISLNPESGDAWLNRGLAHERGGRLDEALKDYARAISLNPDDYLAYSYRGAVLGKSGRCDKAVEDQTKAIALKHDYAAAYVARARCYAATGNEAAALLDYRSACDLGDEEGCRGLRTSSAP